MESDPLGAERLDLITALEHVKEGSAHSDMFVQGGLGDGVGIGGDFDGVLQTPWMGNLSPASCKKKR